MSRLVVLYRDQDLVGLWAMPPASNADFGQWKCHLELANIFFIHSINRRIKCIWDKNDTSSCENCTKAGRPVSVVACMSHSEEQTISPTVHGKPEVEGEGRGTQA